MLTMNQFEVRGEMTFQMKPSKILMIRDVMQLNSLPSLKCIVTEHVFEVCSQLQLMLTMMMMN